MRYPSVLCLALAAVAVPAAAQNVNVHIENLQRAGGLSFTPFWLGLSDDSFNLFDPGASAAAFPGVEEVAELGATAAITGRFSSQQPAGVQTTFAEPNGAPVFEPGESASIDLDAAGNRYFSYLSMVVPTNDLFVGNGMLIELFDDMGNFNGPITIDLLGSRVWDAGTEVNSINDGGAFVSGVDATQGIDEGGVIALILPGGQSYIDSIVGTTTATGAVITQSFGDTTLLGRITITPAPSAAALLGLGVLGAARRRR